MTRHSIDSATLYRCDCCGKTKVVRPDDTIAPPWRGFTQDGWIGRFIACSDICEARYRKGVCSLGDDDDDDGAVVVRGED